MRSARLLKRDLKVNLYKMKNVKTKKSYEGKIKTNFHDNKMPKEASQYICLLVILIDFILKCFQETVNMLLKKKRSLNILLKVQKFLLMRKILIIHTNLMKDNFPLNKHSSCCRKQSCAAAIVHRNHFFRLYQKDKSSGSKVKFRQASNHY